MEIVAHFQHRKACLEFMYETQSITAWLTWFEYKRICVKYVVTVIHAVEV